MTCCSKCVAMPAACPVCREPVQARVLCDVPESLATKCMLQRALHTAGALQRIVQVLAASASCGGEDLTVADAATRTVELVKLLYLKAICRDVSGTILAATPELEQAWRVARALPEAYLQLCTSLDMPLMHNDTVYDCEERERRARRTWFAVLDAFPAWPSHDALMLWRSLRPWSLCSDDMADAAPDLHVHAHVIGLADAPTLTIRIPTNGNVASLLDEVSKVTGLGADGTMIVIFRGTVISNEPNIALKLQGVKNGATLLLSPRLSCR